MQSSYLTRRVFRAIINNETVCFAHRRSRIYSSATLLRDRSVYNKYGQSRTFFTFPSSARKETAEVPTSEVGLQAMSELSKAMSSRGRAPSFNALCKAYQKFFEARSEEPGIITEFHAKQLVNTYEYLRTHHQDSDADSNEWEMINSKETSELILYVLSQANCHRNAHRYVRIVAHNAYRALSAASVHESSEMSYEALLAWVRILAFYGNPYHAREVLVTSWSKLQSFPELNAQGSPWLWVLHGLALNCDQFKLEKLVQELALDYDFTLTPQLHEEMVVMLVEQDRVDAAKVMYSCPLPKQDHPTTAATIAVARAAILSSDEAWAESVLVPLSSSPRAETRDILLLMEAARGKNASALAEMLDTWYSKVSSVRNDLSISSVNDLIRYAHVIGDQQLAVEYAELITKWGLESDLDTFFLLELESRIQGSDIQGTIKVLRDLEESDASTNISQSMRNRLIKMLCQSPSNEDAFDQVSKLLDPFIQDNNQLEPETLAALTHMLAYRHDWEALSRLLRPRLGSYSLNHERPLIRDALTKFIKDRGQNDDEVWEAYDLLRMAFPESDTEFRINLMEEFFERRMLDKGCQVFGHMRHAVSPNQRPTAEAYISCFLGLARASDWSNIKLIRNMLKLDVDIEVTTRIRNAVMIALAECQRSDEAMDEFRDILRSDEGPTQNTLSIFFKVCESHPNGIVEANKMLNKITALDIPLDRRLYLAYIKAIAAQGELELAIEALEKTTAQIGQQPDKDMIARIYNICPHEFAKEGIEEWTKQKHPAIWQELESVPRSETEEGLYFEGFAEEYTP